MGFKNLPLKSIVPFLLIGFLIISLVSWKLFFNADSSASENAGTQNQVPISLIQNPPVVPPMAIQPVLEISHEEDAAIEKQLNRDRQQQKLTKDLKNKLEQTNLELEEEKALAEINKLKLENRGAFNEPSIDGQNNLPEIKVEYIGGDSVKKEAILSIGATSYQVKEKSSPVDNIQVVSISDSSVTLHFSAPQDMTKTIEYKPE